MFWTGSVAILFVTGYVWYMSVLGEGPIKKEKGVNNWYSDLRNDTSA